MYMYDFTTIPEFILIRSRIAEKCSNNHFKGILRIMCFSANLWKYPEPWVTFCVLCHMVARVKHYHALKTIWKSYYNNRRYAFWNFFSKFMQNGCMHFKREHKVCFFRKVWHKSCRNYLRIFWEIGRKTHVSQYAS